MSSVSEFLMAERSLLHLVVSSLNIVVIESSYVRGNLADILDSHIMSCLNLAPLFKSYNWYDRAAPLFWISKVQYASCDENP